MDWNINLIKETIKNNGITAKTTRFDIKQYYKVVGGINSKIIAHNIYNWIIQQNDLPTLLNEYYSNIINICLDILFEDNELEQMRNYCNLSDDIFNWLINSDNSTLSSFYKIYYCLYKNNYNLSNLSISTLNMYDYLLIKQHSKIAFPKVNFPEYNIYCEKTFCFPFLIPHLPKNLIESIIHHLYPHFVISSKTPISEKYIYEILNDLYKIYDILPLTKYLCKEILVSSIQILTLFDNWLFNNKENNLEVIVEKYHSLLSSIQFIYNNSFISKDLLLFLYKWFHIIEFSVSNFPSLVLSCNLEDNFQYDCFSCKNHCYLCETINEYYIKQFCYFILNHFNKYNIIILSNNISSSLNNVIYYISLFDIIYDILFNNINYSFTFMLLHPYIKFFIDLINMNDGIIEYIEEYYFVNNIDKFLKFYQILYYYNLKSKEQMLFKLTNLNTLTNNQIYLSLQNNRKEDSINSPNKRSILDLLNNTVIHKTNTKYDLYKFYNITDFNEKLTSLFNNKSQYSIIEVKNILDNYLSTSAMPNLSVFTKSLIDVVVNNQTYSLKDINDLFKHYENIYDIFEVEHILSYYLYTQNEINTIINIIYFCPANVMKRLFNNKYFVRNINSELKDDKYRNIIFNIMKTYKTDICKYNILFTRLIYCFIKSMFYNHLSDESRMLWNLFLQLNKDNDLLSFISDFTLFMDWELQDIKNPNVFHYNKYYWYYFTNIFKESNVIIYELINYILSISYNLNRYNYILSQLIYSYIGLYSLSNQVVDYIFTELLQKRKNAMFILNLIPNNWFSNYEIRITEKDVISFILNIENDEEIINTMNVILSTKSNNKYLMIFLTNDKLKKYLRYINYILFNIQFPQIFDEIDFNNNNLSTNNIRSSEWKYDLSNTKPIDLPLPDPPII